jgi:hypothetical protein
VRPTPGIARTLWIAALKNRAMASGFEYLFCGRRNCSVNTRDASKPIGARCTAIRLWISSADTATSVTDSAISTTIRTSRVRRPAPVARRDPACSTRLRSGRAARSAGARPQIIAVSSATPPVKSSIRPSSGMLAGVDTAGGLSHSMPFSPQRPSRNPAADAAIASSPASTIS